MIPEISVIVPVYNVGLSLEKCLASLVCQTFKDVEFVLVDDASTDSSGIICDEYAGQDSRFRVIHKARNESILQARKTGLEASKGLWVLFLDGDDYLYSPTVLEDIKTLIETHDVDILKFSVEIRIDNEEQKQGCLDWIGTESLTIRGGYDLVRACFFEGLFSWHLWNKVYRKSVLNMAFKHIGNQYVNAAEDLYQFFLISYFASTFKAIETPPYYVYRVGSGLTTHAISLQNFSFFINEYKVVEWLRMFLQKERNEEQYGAILDQLGKRLLNTVVHRFLMLPDCAKPVAYESLKHWPGFYEKLFTDYSNHIKQLEQKLHDQQRIELELNMRIQRYEKLSVWKFLREKLKKNR